MKAAPYIPDRGDIIWLDFTPQRGREQAGRRPALVLSPRNFNKVTQLAICCPVTSKVKGYSFEVVVQSKKISGAVLSDQVRSIDWAARQAQFIDKLAPHLLAQVQGKLKAILF
ncbi:MAG: endoribonuclease MazF [Alphaproteobacteria bacterium]|nr:endoribonuclease MazF [Alphaproteobacteria bacterium]NDC57189.1 endoribonuclease MazF [Alphaproteobacteria bacterium]